MKKPILLLISFLIFSQNIFSQDTFSKDDDSETQGEHPHEKYSEVGINATSFINEFVSLNSNDAAIGDYMITYKYHFGSKAFRLGLGGNFSQMDEDTDGNGTRNTNSNSFDIRIGYEWNKKITKRWAFYSGMDIIAGNNFSSSVSDNFERVETSSRTTIVGGGPVLGIQFFINSHISLMTEGSLYYKHSIINTKETFSLNGEFNKDDTNSRNDLNFGLPTALFFVIRF
ncbi:MAG: hypothetical protein AB8F94_20235 [Saprospiraceae bacterium]